MEHAGLAEAIAAAVQAARGSGDPALVAAALAAVPASAVEMFLHASFADTPDRSALTIGVGASPGAASGIIALSADEALDLGDAGHAVILVRPETTPDDVMGMQAARGILTTRGGITSHAAVVARGWGIPAVVGAGEIVLDGQGLRVGERFVAAGTEISIDGRTGEVFVGGASTATAAAPPEFDTLLQWADHVRWAADPPVRVRANADNAADAAHARRMGAEGIGLCRTEHMFLAEDRLPLVRGFILTEDPAEEATLLERLETAQLTDFVGILREMDGLPVTVRLLDPPLHEFLPELERLVVGEALGTLDAAGRSELAAVRRLHEVNPMIGTRGVRLGVIRPGIYQMQVRALLRAIDTVRSDGGHPVVELMIPLVIDAAEMRAARRWVHEAATAVGFHGPLAVGAMLETPRAAILADEIALESDFCSFGTNDLTQLTFAFSRDDVGSRLVPEYVRTGLLVADPFETLDPSGVGRLVRLACDAARGARPDVKLGVCGEQAGDPASARFFVDCGVDYVSCSPYRVPVARLAVAQALLADHRVPRAALVDLAG